jgi:hypothetical protein
MGLRALLHRIPLLDRRWIPRHEEREAHAEIVRERLESGAVPVSADHSDSPDPDAETAGASTAEGGRR